MGPDDGRPREDDIEQLGGGRAFVGKGATDQPAEVKGGQLANERKAKEWS